MNDHTKRATLRSMDWDEVKAWAGTIAFGIAVILGIPAIIIFANVILPMLGGYARN